ncbi:MAG: hypothetical protein ACLFQS_03430 [Bacteroidales bacterium]
MEQTFSHGKIILFGEYAVLEGNDAVCLPLATGQKLEIQKNDHQKICWQWSYKNTIIADFSLDPITLQPHEISQGDPAWAAGLITAIRKQNNIFLTDSGYNVRFINHFPHDWGLGSSSATIASLCRIAGADPYIVNDQVMGGSGADIACTDKKNWFVYRKKKSIPQTWFIPFDFPFQQHVVFVYSGQKQATAEHLKQVKEKSERKHFNASEINTLVYRCFSSNTVAELMSNIQMHEQLISEHTGHSPLGGKFPDFNGQIKSLGAWGGDFFMAVSLENQSDVKNYFQKKGFGLCFTWDEFLFLEKF